MTTSDVERQLAAVLHRQAGAAMTRTDTRAELDRFHHRVGRRSRTAGRRGLAAGAAAAAAVVAVSAWYSGLGQDDGDSGPADPGATQTEEERVAQNFAEALTAHDKGRVLAALADDATIEGSLPGNREWSDMVALKEAWSTWHDVQPCQETGSSDYGTSVVCPFDYHSLRSEQLGMAPFGENNVSVVVTEGRIRSFQVSYNSSDNGEAELYRDIRAWALDNHREEWPFLHGSPSAAETPRWIRLWQLRTQQYVDETTSQ